MPLRFMTTEMIVEYPALARASKYCQGFTQTHKGGCSGCYYMVEGCENIINEQPYKEQVFKLLKIEKREEINAHN